MNKNQVHLTHRSRLWASYVLMMLLLLAACGGQAPSAATPTATTVAQPSGAPPTLVVATPIPVLPTATTQPPTPTPTSSAPTAPPATPTAQAQTVLPTPTCSKNLGVTPAQTEGPYYKPNTPERTSLLEAGSGGTKIMLTGYVLTTDCKPIAHALLDFWQADDKGAYDNTGYNLRGHLFTDVAGQYTLETIVPGLYPGRTRHIHVKVQAPNQTILTTQVYFPNEARNQSDAIFNRALLLNVQDGNPVVSGTNGNGKVATFNFVLNMK